VIAENSSRYPTLEKSYLYAARVGLCGWWKISVRTHETTQHQTFLSILRK